MIPHRFSHYVFGLMLSGLMSCVVSFIATVRAVGFPEGLLGIWLPSWLSAWVVAYPTLLVVSPIARRLVAKITAPPEA